MPAFSRFRSRVSASLGAFFGLACTAQAAYPEKPVRMLLPNDQGVEPRSILGAEFDALYQREVARWAKVVQQAGITPE